MNPIWEEEIQNIERLHKGMDRVDLVFIGSSSIVYWSTLKEDFKAYSVVKAGFGGSRIQDAIDAFDRVVKIHHPKIVVLFSGTNDINGDADTAPAEYVVEKVTEFQAMMKKKLPESKLFYLSLTPAPCRFHVFHEVVKANRLIKHLAKEKGFTFIDMQAAFLDEGKPKPEYFVEDMLHMNEKGYAIWISTLKPQIDQAMRTHCL